MKSYQEGKLNLPMYTHALGRWQFWLIFSSFGDSLENSIFALKHLKFGKTVKHIACVKEPISKYKVCEARAHISILKVGGWLLTSFIENFQIDCSYLVNSKKVGVTAPC